MRLSENKARFVVRAFCHLELQESREQEAEEEVTSLIFYTIECRKSVSEAACPHPSFSCRDIESSDPRWYNTHGAILQLFIC